MIGDEERAADREVRAHYGHALDEFSIVPQAEADEIMAASVPVELLNLKRDALILAKHVGKAQNGGNPVPHRWATGFLGMLGENTLGVDRWSIDRETSVPAVAAVVEAAKEQARLHNIAESERFLAQQGDPF